MCSYFIYLFIFQFLYSKNLVIHVLLVLYYVGILGKETNRDTILSSSLEEKGHLIEATNSP